MLSSLYLEGSGRNLRSGIRIEISYQYGIVFRVFGSFLIGNVKVQNRTALVVNLNRRIVRFIGFVPDCNLDWCSVLRFLVVCSYNKGCRVLDFLSGSFINEVYRCG